MQTTKIFSLAGLAVAAVAMSGMLAPSSDYSCGRKLQVADSELRAALASLDRNRDRDMARELAQVCKLYRESIRAHAARNG